MPIEAHQTVILFDLDGTLVDSIDFILESFRHAFVANGLPPKPDAYWKRTIGTPIREQLSEWEYGPDMLDRVLAEYRKYNLAHHDERIKAYDGIAQLLSDLVDRRVRIGVVTSKSRVGAERGLANCGLEKFMDELISVDDVSRGKPHPEPVLTALTRFRAHPANTYFVGDSIYDMQAGRAARVKTVAALWGPFDREVLEPADPDYWREHPADVLSLVDL